MYQKNIRGVFSDKFQTAVQYRHRSNKLIYHIRDNKDQQVTEFQSSVLAEQIG